MVIFSTLPLGNTNIFLGNALYTQVPPVRDHAGLHKCGVVRCEYEDPWEQVEDAHCGLGYPPPLTEVVEEDQSTEEESSSEVCPSSDSDTRPPHQTKMLAW